MRISLWLLCGLWLLPGIVSAQIPTFSITGADNGAPLYMAYVQNLRSGEASAADEQGLAYVYADPGDSDRISYVGYQDTVVTVLAGQAD